MRRLYILPITIVVYALAFASLGAAGAKDRNGSDVTQKPNSSKPIPTPYPNGPGGTGTVPTSNYPTPHGPRSEPQYPLPPPGR